MSAKFKIGDRVLCDFDRIQQVAKDACLGDYAREELHGEVITVTTEPKASDKFGHWYYEAGWSIPEALLTEASKAAKFAWVTRSY